jgi:hypothetical protein
LLLMIYPSLVNRCVALGYGKQVGVMTGLLR